MNKLKKCLYCNTTFDRPLRTRKDKFKISWNQYKNRRFCSNKCRSLYHSKTSEGRNNANWKGGKTKCVDCNKELTQRYSFRNTIRCRECWRLFIKNPENSPNWKGGITERITWRIEQFRENTFKRDNYTCQICGDKKGGNLNAHHIFEFSQYPEYRYNHIFGITLCKECHKLIHSNELFSF